MSKYLYDKTYFLFLLGGDSPTPAPTVADDDADDIHTTADTKSVQSFSDSLRAKRARAGRMGGRKTAATHDMRKIGRMGGIAAQKNGTAHRLTKEERSRGGAHSRRT